MGLAARENIRAVHHSEMDLGHDRQLANMVIARDCAGVGAVLKSQRWNAFRNALDNFKDSEE